MASISINTSNKALEYAVETYTKQIMFSKDYELFLSK